MNQGEVIGKLVRCAWGAAAMLVAMGAQALSVGSGGQASYGLSIAVPPGVSGMSPNLALSYADGGINGPVGVGWSVQGISTVTRCPSSKLTDGTVGADGVKVLSGSSRSSVRFNAQDRLCLDGQRLIAVNASTGAALGATSDDAAGLSGSTVREFRTEKDSFARIRAYGSAVSGNADAGPDYIKVWTKSGQIYEYGTSPAGGVASQSRINAQGTNKVAVWAVSRISDTLGNYIDFKYEVRGTSGDLLWGSGAADAGAPGQEWNVVEVQYTGNASLGRVSQNKVVFEYVDRLETRGLPADRSEAYQGSSKNLSIRLLKAVRTYINSANPEALGKGAAAIHVRTWSLDYDKSVVSGRSRLTTVTECSDEAKTKCLPATRLTYSNGEAPNFGPIASFYNADLAKLPLIALQGELGTLTGDFNGDGRTDVLRWTEDPAGNRLYLSNAAGGFTQVSALTSATDKLFSQNGCFSSVAMDFNGDGITDILRIAKTSGENSNCTAGIPSRVYLSNGAGGFTATDIAAGINFAQSDVTVTPYRVSCVPARPIPPVSPTGTSVPAGSVDKKQANGQSALPIVNDGDTRRTCFAYSYSQGQRYYLLDVNGDGLADIVTTKFPGFSWNRVEAGPMPPMRGRCSDAQLFKDGVAPIVCTRVFVNQGDGTFQEDRPGTHPNQYQTLYADQPITKTGFNPYWRRPTEADADGDGLLDIFSAYGGVFRNRGDGSFETLSEIELGGLCALTIDFNGDQRQDCLQPESDATTQQLVVNASAATTPVARFNLTTAADQLYGQDGQGVQNLGVLVEDLNGDGRQDILRWSTDGTQNGIYLSNGDGSFSARVPAGLTALSEPLVRSDGTRSFITGDFLGNGTLQIMQLRNDASASNPNVLLALGGDRTPLDVLVSVTTGSGVQYRVDQRELLTTSTAYTRDPQPSQTPAALGVPVVLDVMMPSYIITSTTKSNPSQGDVQTRYSYRGFKVERNGRGMLGFKETRQQTKAPNGEDLTVVTRNLLIHPYIGVAGVTETYRGAYANGADIAAQPLSRTTYSYCDKTSAATPASITDAGLGAVGVAPAPCATTALIQRPYLYQSLEQGQDLIGASLPTVRTTNTYNDTGDPVRIEVSTAVAGQAQTFTKTVENSYETPPQTSGDNWILGRLMSAKVTQAVLSASLPATVAGSAPRAADRDGSGPLVPLTPVLTLALASTTSPSAYPTAATAIYRVGNTGNYAATGIRYSAFSGVTLGSGPTSCQANTVDCGTVTVTSGTAVGNYVGKLTATSVAGANADANVSLSVNIPPPTITVNRLHPVYADLPGLVTWTATNAGSLNFHCTATGPGLNIDTTAPLIGLDTGAASASWVGNPSQCTWTAAAADGRAAVFSETLNVLATPHSGPITVARQRPVYAGLPGFVSWQTKNAVSLKFHCTAVDPGLNINTDVPLNGLDTGAAPANWVGHPSQCTWTATLADGSTAVYTETLDVQAAPSAPSLPTIKVARQRPVYAGLPGFVSWEATNAISLNFSCTAANPTLNLNVYVPLVDRDTGASLASRVGYPLQCTWTATASDGHTAIYNEVLETLPAP